MANDKGMAPDQSVWVWMIYQLDTRQIFGALRRCERAHWTSAQASEELQGAADEMQIGHIKWDHVDDRTIVGRSDLDYMAVVTSVLLPSGELPEGEKGRP